MALGPWQNREGLSRRPEAGGWVLALLSPLPICLLPALTGPRWVSEEWSSMPLARSETYGCQDSPGNGRGDHVPALSLF